MSTDQTAGNPAADLCGHCGGTGFEPPEPGMDAIRAYMTATGWKPDPYPGEVGTLWHREGWPHAIGVFSGGEPGGMECRSVIKRLSWAEGRGEPEICTAILRSDTTEGE